MMTMTMCIAMPVCVVRSVFRMCCVMSHFQIPILSERLTDLYQPRILVERGE